MTSGRLSVVVPAYNEERFIGELLDRVLDVDLERSGLDKEVVVVDDCSSDRTAEIASRRPGVVVHRRERNGGKGRAVRDGFRRATGELLMIQDADLEYDPGDYLPMIQKLRETGADAVYGSRYAPPPGTSRWANLLAARHPEQSLAAYLGGRSLSLVMWLFTGHYLTDTVTALKLFRREAVEPLSLESTGFELDHELTAKLLARGCRIEEVRAGYDPRSREEGKKIGIGDWFRAVRTFARFGRRRATA